jgi:predicted ATPase
MRIVLTGGPHAGKTSLAREFERRGARVVREAAIECIARLVRELGPDGARDWRAAHVDEFQERIAHLQVELERGAPEAPDELCFLDRGLLDGLAYCRIAGQTPPRALFESLPLARYDAVVVCELVLPFSSRRQTGRLSSLERARLIEQTVFDVYAEHGYRTQRLECISPVAARADLLLARLAELRTRA